MSGNIFIVSAPSGAGKTTIVKRLLGAVPALVLSVSYTTRKPRAQEKNGIDYTFVDEPKFKEMSEHGKFVEWAEVHGSLYGTPKEEVEKNLVKGESVLLDIDTEGAAKIRKKYPGAVTIFILPPSLDELKQRLMMRGGLKKEELEKRLENAKKEMARRHEYDYQVVNEDIDEAFGEVLDIVNYYCNY